MITTISSLLSVVLGNIQCNNVENLYTDKACCAIDSANLSIGTTWRDVVPTEDKYVFNTLPAVFQGRFIKYKGSTDGYDCGTYYDFTNTTVKFVYYTNASSSVVKESKTLPFTWNALERQLIFKQTWSSPHDTSPSWYCEWYDVGCEGSDPVVSCLDRTWTMKFSSDGDRFTYNKVYGNCASVDLAAGKEAMRQDMWDPNWWWIMSYIKDYDNGGKGTTQEFDTYEEYSEVLGGLKPMYLEHFGEELRFAYNLEYMNAATNAYHFCAEAGSPCSQCPNQN